MIKRLIVVLMMSINLFVLDRRKTKADQHPLTEYLLLQLLLTLI